MSGVQESRETPSSFEDNKTAHRGHSVHLTLSLDNSGHECTLNYVCCFTSNRD